MQKCCIEMISIVCVSVCVWSAISSTFIRNIVRVEKETLQRRIYDRWRKILSRRRFHTASKISKMRGVLSCVLGTSVSARQIV